MPGNGRTVFFVPDFAQLSSGNHPLAQPDIDALRGLGSLIVIPGLAAQYQMIPLGFIEGTVDVSHRYNLATQFHFQLLGAGQHHGYLDGRNQHTALAYRYRDLGAGLQRDRIQFQVAPVGNAQMLNQPQPESGQVAELSVALPLQGAGNGHRHPHIDDRGRIGPLKIQALRQLKSAFFGYGHLQVKGTAYFVIRAGLAAGVDAPVTGAARQTGQRIVETISVLIQATVGQRSTAQLKRIGECGKIHATAPVGHCQVNIVLVRIRCQRHTDPGLFARQYGGEGVIAPLEDTLMEEHSLTGQPDKGLASDVDSDFVALVGASGNAVHVLVVHIKSSLSYL